MKEIKNALVVDNKLISPNIYSMTLDIKDIAQKAKAGQFVNLYCKAESRLLPRPISICEIDKEKGRIVLVYGVVGKGTEEFGNIKRGESIEVLGPLGNGFMIDETKRKNIIVGGGLGTPPLVELVKHLKVK